MPLNYESIAKLPALQGLAPSELEALFKIAQRLAVKAGERVIRAGDQADCFFILVQGTLDVVAKVDGKSIPIAQLGPGQLVGEMPLIYTQRTRQADVIASSEANLLRWSYREYDALGKQLPNLASIFRSNLGRIVAARTLTNVGIKTTPAGLPGSAPAAPSAPSLYEILKQAQIFAGLTDQELHQVEAIAQPYPVEQGQTVVRAGDPANSLFLVAKGQLEVQLERNGKTFPLARVGTGQIIGEMALIYKQPTRSATVVAVDTSRLFMIDFEDFNRLTTQDPGLGKKLKNNLGRVAASRAWSLPEADEARALKHRNT